LAYANDVNILGEKVATTQNNTEVLLDANKEVSLEVNLEKTKYLLTTRCKKAGQKRSIKIANRSFGDVAKFGYLGTTLTDQNCMQEEIKSRLNSGNACYHSVQAFTTSCSVEWGRVALSKVSGKPTHKKEGILGR
jgi:hypothetical protein